MDERTNRRTNIVTPWAPWRSQKTQKPNSLDWADTIITWATIFFNNDDSLQVIKLIFENWFSKNEYYLLFTFVPFSLFIATLVSTLLYNQSKHCSTASLGSGHLRLFVLFIFLRNKSQRWICHLRFSTLCIHKMMPLSFTALKEYKQHNVMIYKIVF